MIVGTARWLIDASKVLDDDDPVHRAAVVVLLRLVREHAREHPPTDSDCRVGLCPDAQALAQAVLSRRSR